MAGAEEQDGLRHFIRLADSPQQMEGASDAVGFGFVAVGDVVHQAAPGPTGRDGVDANFVAGQVHGFVAGKLKNGRFRNRIEPAARLRHLGADAAEVDHGPAAALDHVRARRLQHHHAAHHVNVVAVEPVLARGIESVVYVNASQVDQKIHAAESGNGSFHAGGDLGVVGEIGFQEQHVFAQLPGHGLAALLIDVGDHNLGAFALKSAHHGGANQSGAAGDDAYLALDAFHAVLRAPCRFEEGKPYHGTELPNKWGGAVGLPANMLNEG